MKIKKEEGVQSKRQKYTVQFKAQVLERADRDGIPKTAQDLGIAESLLYLWRAKSRQTPASLSRIKGYSKQKQPVLSERMPVWKMRWLS